MPVQESTEKSKIEKQTYPEIERIYREWDEALSRNDASSLLNLYAGDAELESPLVPHLMGGENGTIRGHADLAKFFDVLATRKPRIRQFYRAGYLTDGHKVMWEYPRATPQGEQMDFLEVMEIQDGLIQKHRVYWGWFGFDILRNNKYHQ